MTASDWSVRVASGKSLTPVEVSKLVADLTKAEEERDRAWAAIGKMLACSACHSCTRHFPALSAAWKEAGK